MKYIRMKDHGVCKVISEDKYTITYQNKEVVGCMDKDAYKMQQANTIEELCDEFVGIDDNGARLLSFMPKYCASRWNKGVYGAIWTDKGLIYVAKVNDEGELELL